MREFEYTGLIGILAVPSENSIAIRFLYDPKAVLQAGYAIACHADQAVYY